MAEDNDFKAMFSIGLDGIKSAPVGDNTGKSGNDFYVYEWYIVDTGEIFYVGKGRGNRYKAFHDSAYVAEDIKKQYKTANRFVKKGLTEQEAVELESEEMTRILNETNYRLTNRQIPFGTDRFNGYDRAPDTPPFKLDTAPMLWVDENSEHYFHDAAKPFDPVTADGLRGVTLETPVDQKELKAVYGDNFGQVIQETLELLDAFGTKVVSSRYAKSVTGWIFMESQQLINVQYRKDKAQNDLGRTIPAYHLVDVHHFLLNWAKDNGIQLSDSTSVPVVDNTRVPLAGITRLSTSDDEYWEQDKVIQEANKASRTGDYDTALKLLDQARAAGMLYVRLYNSYFKIYHKLGEYKKELALADEALQVFSPSEDVIDYIDVLKRRMKILKKL
ncbi:GIY-YIG nuclease family protein [Lacticaseibacillus sp. 866-1]|uniref:GIY-YIG nuclease family protein n=1 Tax=Lacticaseibacillus sp. 866-1 TaxID=2799576 RepID=UPI001940D266|nr:GIY-YIG nuclease family protein [Lacticaseibacillus sp. 866-1]